MNYKTPWRSDTAENFRPPEKLQATGPGVKKMNRAERSGRCFTCDTRIDPCSPGGNNSGVYSVDESSVAGMLMRYKYAHNIALV